MMGVRTVPPFSGNTQLGPLGSTFWLICFEDKDLQHLDQGQVLSSEGGDGHEVIVPWDFPWVFGWLLHRMFLFKNGVQ